MRDIALFVDYDNAQLEAERKTFSHCSSSRVWAGSLVREIETVCDGKVSIRRAYGDVMLKSRRIFADKQWNPEVIRGLMNEDLRMQKDLADNGFQAIHCPTISGGGKNRADIFLSLDCFEIAAQYSNIEVIAIMSHDSDISALCQKIRTIGKDVAIVTMDSGRPRMLRSLATHLVTYDQKTIDRYGYNQVTSLVEKLRADKDRPLDAGVSVEAFRSMLRDVDPDFAPDAVGFEKYYDLLDDCLENGVQRVGAMIKSTREPPRIVRTPPPPAPARRSTAEVSPSSVEGFAGLAVVAASRESVASSREEVLFASLRSVGVRPVPELRRNISRFLADNLPLMMASGEPLLYRELRKVLEERFHDPNKDVSKSKINDAVRVLTLSGALRLAESDGGLATSVVVEFLPQDQTRNRILRCLVRRLADSGITVHENDASAFCRVVFNDETPDLIDATLLAIAQPDDPDVDL